MTNEELRKVRFLSQILRITKGLIPKELIETIVEKVEPLNSVNIKMVRRPLLFSEKLKLYKRINFIPNTNADNGYCFGESEGKIVHGEDLIFGSKKIKTSWFANDIITKEPIFDIDKIYVVEITDIKRSIFGSVEKKRTLFIYVPTERLTQDPLYLELKEKYNI